MKNSEIWGELIYVIDLLDHEGSDIHERLDKAAFSEGLDFQEFMNRCL
ncbi:MAG: hypothetical protein OXC27_09360 [Caldilineaceae bacterium]|nr:hypothetical protein [Caldilineaceae bacterium]